MTYNYFIASRFRNKEMVLPFVGELRKKNKTVYCFLETAPSQNYVGTLEEDAEESMKLKVFILFLTKCTKPLMNFLKACSMVI